MLTSHAMFYFTFQEAIKSKKELEDKDIDFALSQLQADKVYLQECQSQYESALATGDKEDVSHSDKLVLENNLTLDIL